MILIINSGSSSVKYRLYNIDLNLVCNGLVEKIGEGSPAYKHKDIDKEPESGPLNAKTHAEAFDFIVKKLLGTSIKEKSDIQAIGHRVVHGGDQFSETTLIDESVKKAIEDLIPLAPLHNPANLEGINMASAQFPKAKQVAVFDTAFHQTIPEHAYRYAIPENYYTDYGIRKYGFHGISHQYITRRCQQHFKKEEVNLIIAHLGNGCSITAVRDGFSIDNTLGFSPLPGLIMGTRSGDIDPSLIFHLIRNHNISPEEIEKMLNKKSGLLSIAGKSDLRGITEEADKGDESAKLALRMYTYRIRQYIGAYLAQLSEIDALVFTAGVGENSARVRADAMQGMEPFGFKIDQQKNKQTAGKEFVDISAENARIPLLVIATDEEKQIAMEVKKVIE
ncbi:MAG: acetate/propionate family kinase [Candidatus Cyclobacteriaceae bacterium M2_1C_046]